MISKESLLVFSGNATSDLGKKICNYLKIPQGKIDIGRFSDGEIDIKINEDIRGGDVFIVQSTRPPVNDNLMELLLIIDCVRRASAERITAVLPYFGYARQDRKAEGRVPISAKLVANIITTAGANRVLTIDLHAPQIQGFFDIPVDHLFAAPVLVDYFKKKEIPNLTIVSPDVGSIKMARAYAKRLNADLSIVDKRRINSTETQVMHLIGDVKNKNALIVDDIVSTGTSLVEAINTLKKYDVKEIYACITHPILCANAVEKIAKTNIKELVVTDTIPIINKTAQFIKVLSISSLIGEAIRRIHKSESVSSLFV